MKRRMGMLVMLALLVASSPALVACQTKEWVEEASVGPKTFTTLTTWGGNFFGQLGDGTSVSRRTTPVEVSNLDGAELRAIAGGQLHSLALKEDGTVLAWGYNEQGQLGDGTSTDGAVTTCEITQVGPTILSSCTDSNTLVQASELDGIEAIAAGGEHNLAGW